MILEERMTSEERELFERWKMKIGEVYVSQNDQEVITNEVVIYFYGLGREASWTMIKRWAAVNEDFNALWFDEEYAKKSRWEGIVAPPLYLISVNDGLEWSTKFTSEVWGQNMEPKDEFPNFLRTLQAESEWEFFEPVRPGDTIDAKCKLADLYWKQGKKDRMLFVVSEVTYTNQKGQLVGKNRPSCVFLFK
jgi:acyl dehydratase